MEQLIKDFTQQVKNLQETLASTFSRVDTAAADAEKKALVDKVKELDEALAVLKKAKAVQKMVFAVGEVQVEAGSKSIGFNRYLKAVVNKDLEILDLASKAANGQSEGVNADGAFAIPTEFANEIVKLERIYGVLRSIAKLVPMGSLTRKVPVQLTQPTMTWTGEAVNHTKTKITLAQVTQTAKKLSALIPLTEELINDNNVGIDAVIFAIVAQGMGREEDRVGFVGNTGSGDPFNGVLNAAGVNSASMSGASLDWRDLITQQFSIIAPYRKKGTWVVSSDALKIIMGLKDDQNRPIWQPALAGQPGSILNRPYVETDVFASTLGDGTQTAVLYGDFADYFWLSDRSSYEVKASDSASDANGGAGSAFLQDEIWFKFRKRLSLDVILAAAFSKMFVG